MKNVLYGIRNGIDSYFGVTDKGSTFSKEILAGILVFFSMMYILPVNSSILSNITMADGNQIPSGAIFATTAICTFICTFIMGLFARLPLMLSCSMGMNAYLAFTVSGQLGFTMEECFAIVIVSGILFFILSVSGLRMKIVNALPKGLKLAISAGLGFFIAFVGLKMGGIIVEDSTTLVKLNSFDPSNGNGYVLLCLFGIVLGIALNVCKVKIIKQFSIIIALAVTALLGGFLGLAGVENMPMFIPSGENANNIADISLVFGSGFKGFTTIFTNPSTYGVIISLLIVNVFDTTATLVGLGPKIGIINEEHKMVNYKKAFFTDGIAPIVGGIVGTSPIATFAESSVGVEFGSKTGISAITTSLLFALMLAISPVFNVFLPIDIGNGNTVTPVTALPLVLVGAMMFMHLKDLNWQDWIEVCASFITVIMMILTYSLTDGIAFGVIAYTVMMICSGQFRKISVLMYVLCAIFIVNFVILAIL